MAMTDAEIDALWEKAMEVDVGPQFSGGTVLMLLNELREARAECFALAARTCDEPIADEGGSMRCGKQDALRAALRQANELYRDIHSKWGVADQERARAEAERDAAQQRLAEAQADSERLHWLEARLEIRNMLDREECSIRFPLLAAPEAECPPLRELIDRARANERDEAEEGQPYGD